MRVCVCGMGCEGAKQAPGLSMWLRLKDAGVRT